MSGLKKTLVITLVLIFVLLVFGFLFVNRMATRGLPDYDGQVQLAHLKAPVKIERDQYGIPHIFAKNEDDLYRATGYCMAQDRLWQMDLIRRATEGRLSEIFGKDMVNADLLLRALRIPEKSARVLNQSAPEVRASLEAFSDGVNQYIQSRGKDLPPEFQILGYSPDAWEPRHSINLIGYMAWDLTMPWNAEIALHKIIQKVGPEMAAQLFPDVTNQPVVYEDFTADESDLDARDLLMSASKPLRDLGLQVFGGSNNWAVSGKKSVTGKPLFANDMHLGLFIPGIWYQIYQSVEGKFTVTGLALPGEPCVVAGHNDRIAWGMTNVMVDDMDFFKEKVNPDNPNQYEFNGQWKDMDVRHEKIKTKDGDVVEKTLRFTHRGPIISDFKHIKNETLSMQWTGNLPSDEVRGVYLLNHAQNWNEFKNAVSTFNSVSQNIAYADVDGNIGIYCCAGVPVRKHSDGKLIEPGWTDKYDWAGIVPFDKLPHSYNPPKGYVSSANNRSVSADASTQVPQYPAPNYRIDRIRELLNAKDKLSIDDFKAIQRDHQSVMAKDFVPGFLNILEDRNDLSQMDKSALNLLKSWDYKYEIDRSAASIFEQMYMELMHNLLWDEIGDTLYADYINVGFVARFAMDYLRLHPDSKWVDNVNTEQVETWDGQVALAFQSAVKRLAEQYGPNPQKWTWGSIHHFVLKHPMGKVSVLDFAFKLNRGPYPIGGASHTVSPFAYNYKAPYNSDFGSSHRHIFSPANWDDSQTVIPTGESGIPASPYYCDQTDLYIHYIYHDDPFSRSAVDAAAKYTLVLNP